MHDASAMKESRDQNKNGVFKTTNAKLFLEKRAPSVIVEEVLTPQMDDKDDCHASIDGQPGEIDSNRLLCISIGNHRFRTRYKRAQAMVYNFLERPTGIISISYHISVFALVLAGLVLAVLETMDEYKNNEIFRFRIYVLELFLLILFTVEYLLRMWSAGCRSTYVGILGRLRFAFKPFVIVDLVVIGSTAAVILRSTVSPRAKLSSAISILRFFQVLRMIRFDRQGGSWKLLGSVLFLHKQELMTTFYIGFCSLIFASFFVYQAEKDVNTKEFGTFADSFWWGVVTLTTVGYGDKIPISWAGRGVAAFFAIMGISFFALPAGILGSGFALKVSQQQRQKHAKRRRRPAATLIQCNWRYYASHKGSKLTATWLPYVRYIQEKNARLDELKELRENHVDKPPPNYARTRKLSIFGRKTSGPSSDGSLVGGFPLDQGKMRARKKSQDLFLSMDSLQDAGQMFNNVNDHRSYEERGGPVIVTDDYGNPSLAPACKLGIRFTRYLKFLVALRKFKLAKKPYDVKDVIEQYSTGHVELIGKVKGISYKIDEALGIKGDKTDESSSGGCVRSNVVYRLSKLEKQVKSLDSKLDQVISLMQKAQRKEHPQITTEPPSDSDHSPCCACRQQASGDTAKGPSSTLKVIDERTMPTKRRKFGLSSRPPVVDDFYGSPSPAKKHHPKLPKSLSLLTPERLRKAVRAHKGHRDLSRSISLTPDHMRRFKDPPEHKDKDYDDNHLSPRPFGGEAFDMRRRSDSAIDSVCSGDKKDGGTSSFAVTPASSDTEGDSSRTTIQRDLSSEVLDGEEGDALPTFLSPYYGEKHVQETKM